MRGVVRSSGLLAACFGVLAVATSSFASGLSSPKVHTDAGAVDGPRIVEIAADTPVLIQSPAGGGSRVLLSFSGLTALQGVTVFSARLEIPGIAAADPFAVELYPVTTAWTSGSVSWGSPWRAAGGDFDPTHVAYTRIAAGDGGGGPIRLNVSMAVRQMINEGAANNGFLLMPALHVGGEGAPAAGFASAVAAALAGTSEIKLVVFCR